MTTQETDFDAQLTALHTLPTAALKRRIRGMQIRWQTADSDQQNALESLLEYAAQELNNRRDSYTGEYDS